MSPWADGTTTPRPHYTLEHPWILAKMSPGASATDNTAALNAACASLATTKGTVLVPAGTLDMNGQIKRDRYVSIKGMGRLATTLRWPSDLGAGQYAITTDETIGTYMHSSVSDIGIVGPVTAVTIGTTPSNMYGVNVQNRCDMHNVRTVGFKAGGVITGDHHSFTDWFSDNNYYGVYFGPGGATYGNHIFSGAVFDHNAHSAVAVHPTSSCDGSWWLGPQIGFSPYGFYREAGTTTRPFIFNTTIIGGNFEGVGNAAFYGENTTDSMISVTCINFGCLDNPAFVLPATVFNQFIRVGEIENVEFGGTTIFSGDPAQCFIRATASADSLRLKNMGTVIGSDLTATVPLLIVDGGSPTFCRFDTGDYAGRIVTANNSFTKGDVVKEGSLDNSASTYTAGAVPFGVAAADITAGSGACVPVAMQGRFNTRFTTSPTNGSLAEADQANLGKAVDGTVPTAYTLGVWKQSGGSSPGRLRLRGLGW